MLQPSFNVHQHTWEIDVPEDGSCLFWAVALAYLMPVKDDDKAFRERFEQLFGEGLLGRLEGIKAQINAYDPFSVDQAMYQDVILQELVRERFRYRVADYMAQHKSWFEGHMVGDFPDSWGGALEIRAMSGLLGCCIQVVTADEVQYFGVGIPIQLFRGAHHYRFGLKGEHLNNNYHKGIQKPLSRRKRADSDADQAGPTGRNIARQGSRSSQPGPLPEGFYVGEAMGGGDCFFDAMAKGMNQVLPDGGFTVASLRRDCKSYAMGHKDRIYDSRQGRTLLAVIAADALNGGYAVSEGNEESNFNSYLARIECTSIEIELGSASAKLLGLNQAIWGRPEIEGRMLCEQYHLQLHVIEKHNVAGKELWTDQMIDETGSRSVSAEDIDYRKDNVVHLVNKGRLHFEPVLDKRKSLPIEPVIIGPIHEGGSEQDQIERSDQAKKTLTFRTATPNSGSTSPSREGYASFLDRSEISGEGSKLAQHGNLFQLKLLMLFLWRAKEYKYHSFRLATEMGEAGKLDDVAFQYQPKGGENWRFRLLQAKHTRYANENKITKNGLLSIDDEDNFSMQKYFHSFLKIKQKSKEGSIYSVFTDSEIEDLIMCTNTDFDSESRDYFEEAKDHFEDAIEKDPMLKLQKDKNDKWDKASIYKLKDWENNKLVSKLKPILEATSDFNRLVEELIDHILEKKQIEKQGLFKDYYYALTKEVFE